MEKKKMGKLALAAAVLGLGVALHSSSARAGIGGIVEFDCWNNGSATCCYTKYWDECGQTCIHIECNDGKTFDRCY